MEEDDDDNDDDADREQNQKGGTEMSRMPGAGTVTTTTMTSMWPQLVSFLSIQNTATRAVPKPYA
jgi:hypothetical protein